MQTASEYRWVAVQAAGRGGEGSGGEETTTPPVSVCTWGHVDVVRGDEYRAGAESDLKMAQLKKHHLKLWKVNATSRPALLPQAWEGDNELLPKEMKLLINSEGKLREVKLHFLKGAGDL